MITGQRTARRFVPPHLDWLPKRRGIDPSPSGAILPGHSRIGDDRLYKIHSIHSTSVMTDREFDLLWTGGSYNCTPTLVGAATWYHLGQAAYVSKGAACTTPGQDRSTTQAEGAGTLDALSLALD